MAGFTSLKRKAFLVMLGRRNLWDCLRTLNIFIYNKRSLHVIDLYFFPRTVVQGQNKLKMIPSVPEVLLQSTLLDLTTLSSSKTAKWHQNMFGPNLTHYGLSNCFSFEVGFLAIIRSILSFFYHSIPFCVQWWLPSNYLEKTIFHNLFIADEGLNEYKWIFVPLLSSSSIIFIIIDHVGS